MTSRSRPVMLVWALALACSASLVAAPRDDARAPLAQAIATLKSGDVRAARAQAAEAVKLDPNWAEAHVVLARSAIGMRSGAAAESELRKALGLGYPEASLRHLFAHAYQLQGNPAGALDVARVERVPAEFAAYAARIRSAARGDLGDDDGAVRELAEAARVAPDDSHVWSDIARLRMYGGDAARARAAATRAVDLDGANVEALTLAGNLVREQYGLAAAIPWYDRALAAEPENMAAMLERAATLGDVGRTREMLAQTRSILADDPGNAQAYYLQAVLAARAGDWGLARALLYRVGDRLDALPGAKLLAALIELNQGNTEQAIAQLRILAGAQPANVKVRRLLGTSLWRGGDDAGAIVILRPLADRPDADSYTLTIIGRAFEQSGNRVEAAEYLGRAAAPARGAPVPFDGNGNLQATGGSNIAIPYIQSLLGAGRSADAIAEAQRFEAQSAGLAAGALLVGDTYYATGAFRDAAAAYTRAANIAFSESTALRLIDALKRAGDAGAAATTLDLFRAQNPLSVAGALLASDILLARKDWQRAELLLESMRVRIGDRDATLMNNLAWAKFSLGKGREALALARAAYALSPGNAPVAASLGWFLAKNGDKAGGAALLEKAVALAPAEPAYKQRLAMLHG